jgi:lipopolysaccharide export system permease protein
MQFLFVYIDDIMGKGLDWHVIARLLFYTSLNLVPKALTLAILLSSIITLGSFGEHYELAAIKASGISLQRVCLPLLVFVSFLGIASFFFANDILPYTNLKYRTLLSSVMQQKPSFDLKEGVFSNIIEGYSIRIEKKHNNGLLENIMIYDHSNHDENHRIVLADSGRMYSTDDNAYLILNLYSGKSYEELNNRSKHTNPKQNPNSPKSLPLLNKEGKIKPTINTHPLRRAEFKERNMRFSLESFAFSQISEDSYKDDYYNMNIFQLKAGKDTIYKQIDEKARGLFDGLMMNYYFTAQKKAASKDSLLQNTSHPSQIKPDTIPLDSLKLFELALEQARRAKQQIMAIKESILSKEKSIVKFEMEWQKKFNLPFACLIMFLIGAPLGAIIRKGGMGAPVLFAIIFFLLHHIISITGEKFARELVISPFLGVWLSVLLLLPIGVFLIRKATADSSLFDITLYIRFFEAIARKIGILPHTAKP